MFARVLGIVLILLLLAGCAGQGDDSPTVSAVDVVSDFYYWYLGYPGNVLAEGGYHESDALSADFITQLDEFVSQRMFYDPILCAQDLPGDYRVLPGASADRVEVQTIWNVGSEYETVSTLEVRLTQTGGQWRIEAIECHAGS